MVHSPPTTEPPVNIVARFRRRNDAEAHLQVLRRLMPDASFEIVFDVEPEVKDLPKGT